MRCEDIDRLLDALMDGELDAEQRRALDEHARVCPDCAEKLRAAEQLKAILSDALPEADVPLPAQAAWRRAVRAEAAQGKRKRLYRWVSASAAALVVLAGVGLMLRGNITLNTSRDAQGTAVTALSDEALEQAVAEDADIMPEEDFAQDGEELIEEDFAQAIFDGGVAMSLDSAPMLDTDGMGAAPEYEAFSMKAAAAAPMREVRMAVSDLDTACGTIHDLLSEYEGSVDEQRFEDNGAQCANLYIQLPGENAADFFSAAAHLDISGENVDYPDVSADGTASLLLVLEQK